MANNDIKLRITHLVTRWELDNPLEYAAFLTARKAKTGDLKNKFAATQTDFIERLLFEMPETLDQKLVLELDEGEMKFLRSKEGSLWFAKSFKQYTVPEKV